MLIILINHILLYNNKYQPQLYYVTSTNFCTAHIRKCKQQLVALKYFMYTVATYTDAQQTLIIFFYLIR